MGLNLKSLMGGKKQENSGDVTQVKKNTQTTDNIISQAVSNAGNLSSMTLSKEEHDRLLTARQKMPFHILLLKYFSLAVMASTIVAGLLLKADLDPRNSYLKFLAVNKNTGSQFVELSQASSVLEQEISSLENEIASLKERREKFDESTEVAKVSLLVPQILEVEDMQKIWFDTTVEELDENENLVEVKKYGLIDSFSNMIEYFEDTAYQPRFFNQKNRDESLITNVPALCNQPITSLTTEQINEKRRLEASGQCPTNSTLIMANEIEIRGLNISANSANVTVSASDLLKRVFTLSSEFVIMMNSFDFYKGAEISNFSRRELDDGGDTTEIALQLSFQEEDEEDPDDQYLIDFIEWEELQS